MTRDAEWDRYCEDYTKRATPEREVPCAAQAAARNYIMRNGLPPGTIVPLAFVCTCPRCSPSGSLAVALPLAEQE